MKFLLATVVVLVVLAGGALLYAWPGIYNIAATQPHWDVTYWFLDMLKERSIDVNSDSVRVPNMDDASLKQAAFSHYHGMCRLCHGAPGFKAEEFSKGLYPEPPSMTEGHIQKELNLAQIYWTAKHGIKMTGMPAFGPTHEEDELWGLAALVQEVDDMSPEGYRQQLDATHSQDKETHQHSH